MVYPAVILFIVQPSAFRWNREHPPEGPSLLQAVGEAARHETEALKHRALHMQMARQELQTILEGSGRWLLLAKFLIAGFFVVIWARWYGFSFALLGISSSPILITLTAGIVGGALLVCGKVGFQSVLKRIPYPYVRLEPWKHPLSRGSVPFWIITFIVGGAFEETWRGVCLFAFAEAGWSQVFAVTITSIAFVFAEYTGFPARTATADYEDVWEFLVGVFLAILFLKFHSVEVPFVASVAFRIPSLLLLRRATASSESERNPLHTKPRG